MKVREVMHRRPMTIAEDEELALAAQMMAWAGIRHLPVLRRGRVVGLLSERDILRHRVEHHDEPGRHDGLACRVAEAMSTPVQVTDPEADLADVGEALGTTKHGCMPVLEDDELVGIVTTSDVLTSEAGRWANRAAPIGLPELTVGDVMTPSPHATSPDDLLLDAAGRMSNSAVRHLPVIDGDGRLVGMLSDRDVRAAIGDPVRALGAWTTRPSIQLMRVRDAMTPGVFTAEEDMSLLEVMTWLVGERLGAVPVTDGRRRLVGIVSYVDVLRALGDYFRRLGATTLDQHV